MIKKGSHLDGVEPINEMKIDNHELLKILSYKAGNTSNFEYLKNIISNSEVYDKSGYSGNSLLICKGKNNSYVVKISKNGTLIDEFISYNYFYKINLTSKPIKYFKHNEYEFLITEYIALPTAGFYFDSYQEIAYFFGKELRKFHDMNLIQNKFSEKEYNLFKNKYHFSYNRALDNDVGLIYMTEYLKDDDINKMKKYLIDNKEILHRNEVLVHGDFNPNNVFIDNNMNIKIIDFCDVGICNKHYDIFWTMFMLIIFSGILKDRKKILECEEIFLNAYGTDKINNEELLFFKYFACLYWKQHDEITRINIL